METARVERGPHLRRDSILEAVAFASERLLLSPDWRDAADEVLARLGEATDVSRAYVIQNVSASGVDAARQVAEWCAPGVASQFGNPSLEDAPWREWGFARWVELLGRGETIWGAVRDLPPAERPELEAQDIASIALVPVFVGSEWWGLVGFDECVGVRDWSGAELDALRAAATVLGAAISRRRADEQLRESEDRYRSLVDNSPDALLVHSEGRFVYANRAAATLLAASEPSALIGLPIMAIVPPEYRDIVKQRVVAESRGVAAPLLRERFVRLDGSEVDVEVAGIPVTYRGKPAGQIVVRDITERLSAEEQLREADVRYRQFVEHIPAVTYMDIVEEGGGRLGFISPQVEPLLGYPPRRFLDDPGFRRTILHPDDRDRVEEAAQRTIDEGAPFVEEYRMIAADGREVWVHDTSTRVDDDHGNLLYRLGFLTDVTARRQAERRRHVAEERYRMIVEHTPVIVYQEALSEGDYDPDTTWNYLSPQVEGVLGYTQDAWESDPAFFWKIVHPDDLERVLAESSRTNESGKPYHQEYRVIAADGREVWVHDDCLLVRDEDGTPLLWQGVMIDITERRRAEDELQRALEVEREAGQRLRAVDEMKNTFLQAVSHDLRTPLAAILGLAVTLERSEVDLDEVDARDLASRIASNARRLERLVSNLLDLDRLSRGIVAPTLEFTEVGALVQRVLSESELLSSARVHTDIAEAVIAADTAKVERIVENLLANSVRHTPADAQVWVSTRAVADGALILVEDDGPGVAPELRETIFEAFRQGPHAPKHSPGVGVGLALVRRFAELHGGHAWVEERAAGGASFRVFLPSSPPEGMTTAADGTDAEAAEGSDAGWEGGSPDRLDGRPAGDDGMVDGGRPHLGGAAG